MTMCDTVARLHTYFTRNKVSIKESNTFVGGSRQLAYRLRVGVDEADMEASIGESRHLLLRHLVDQNCYPACLGGRWPSHDDMCIFLGHKLIRLK